MIKQCHVYWHNVEMSCLLAWISHDKAMSCLLAQCGNVMFTGMNQPWYSNVIFSSNAMFFLKENLQTSVNISASSLRLTVETTNTQTSKVPQCYRKTASLRSRGQSYRYGNFREGKIYLWWTPDAVGWLGKRLPTLISRQLYISVLISPSALLE